jgi:hypothetical protein
MKLQDCTGVSYFGVDEKELKNNITTIPSLRYGDKTRAFCLLKLLKKF